MMLPGILMPGPVVAGARSAPPVIVQSAVAIGGQVSLSGVTPGNLILGLAGSRSALNLGNLSFSGFPATFSRDVDDHSVSTIIRAGAATGSSASLEYSTGTNASILVEIANSDAALITQSDDGYSTFSGDPRQVDAPSRSGFLAGEIAIGFAVSDGPTYNSGAPSSWTILREGDSRFRAIWRVASAPGSIAATNIFNGATGDDWQAHTIRIPAA